MPTRLLLGPQILWLSYGPATRLLKLWNSFLCLKIPDNNIGVYLKGFFLTMVSEANDFCTIFMQDYHLKKEVLKSRGLTISIHAQIFNV